MTTEQTQHARDSAELRRLCSERDQLREKVAEQAREISSLRNIISECATACGAAVSAECSEEFMAMLPDEIRTVMTGKSLEIERLTQERDSQQRTCIRAMQARAALSANHSEQVREIERQTRKLDYYAENLEAAYEDRQQLRAELAALKAQPSGVVRWPEADEIMQMAFEEGQPSEDASGYYFELEEFDLFIQRLMEEVARLNQPVSAGDERTAFEAWMVEVEGVRIKPRFDRATAGPFAGDYRDGQIQGPWNAWQARAALSANHSEQVRHMAPEPVRDALARRCLWLAFCWNDHNFGPAHEEARKEALKHGIDSFDAANEWLATAPSAGSQEQGE